MRLGIPPTLRQSSLLIDSHSLTVTQSPLPRGGMIRRSSKTFKEDGGSSQFGEEQGLGINGDMTITRSNQQKRSVLLTPESGYGILKKKTGTQSQEQIRSSNGSLIRKIPLFNQFQEQQNFSQIRISKKQSFKCDKNYMLNNDYQKQSINEEIKKQQSQSIKHKSNQTVEQVSNDHSNYQQFSSSQLLSRRASQRQIVNQTIQVINQQQSSSQGNSLNGSRKLQQKVALKRSLNNNNNNETTKPIMINQSSRITTKLKSSNNLQPIMQDDGYSNIKLPTNNNKKLQRQQLIQSQQSFKKNIVINLKNAKQQTPTNQYNTQSQQSCHTVQLNQLTNNNHKDNNNHKSNSNNNNSNNNKSNNNNCNNNNSNNYNNKSKVVKKGQQSENVIKIRQKLIQIQKSMKMNEDQSLWEASQLGDSLNYHPHQNIRTTISNNNTSLIKDSLVKDSLFHNKTNNMNMKQNDNINCNKNINDDQKKLFYQMNQRFKIIKSIKNTHNLTKSHHNNQSNTNHNYQSNINHNYQSNINHNQIKLHNSNQSNTKIISQPTHLKTYAQRGTQTIETINTLQDKQNIRSNNNKDNEDNNKIREIHRLYSQQIHILQKQIQRLQRQLNNKNQSYQQLSTIKQQLQYSNRLLNDKIKRLQRILNKNQTQLMQLKLSTNQTQQYYKNNKQPKNYKQKQKQQQEIYKKRIRQLQKQLNKVNNHSFNNTPTLFTCQHPTTITSQFPQKLSYQHPYQLQYQCPPHISPITTLSTSPITISKNDTKYHEHLQRLREYERFLKKNMQILKQQQSKIITQWQFIDHFYTINNIQRKYPTYNNSNHRNANNYAYNHGQYYD